MVSIFPLYFFYVSLLVSGSCSFLEAKSIKPHHKKHHSLSSKKRSKKTRSKSKKTSKRSLKKSSKQKSSKRSSLTQNNHPQNCTTIPYVSIITSLYNGDQFIEGFLKDITRQTLFSLCELIIINAASPGQEEAIIKLWLQRFPNIRYTRLTSDPGLYAVWNMAIQQARAPYIATANIDDRFAPCWLEKFYQELEKCPTIDLVYGDGYRTEIPNSTFENPQPLWTTALPEFSSTVMGTCPPQNQPMWRKRVHDKYGYFDNSFKIAGDLEFWCRMVQKGGRFKKIAGLFGVMYINPQGLSSPLNYAKRDYLYHEEAIIRSRYPALFTG